MTQAEVRLWLRLRQRQLLGLKFRRQHPVGPYIVDFACLSIRLAIEVDGTTHSTEARQAHDQKRTTWLEHNGWQVIRIQNIWIYDDLDNVMDQIADAIGQRPGLPNSCFLGRGRCPEGTEGGSEDKRHARPSPPQTLSPDALKPSSPAHGGARRHFLKTQADTLRPLQTVLFGTETPGETADED